MSEIQKEKQRDLRKLIRNFAIELILYSGLVITYAIVVLNVLGDILTSLFKNNLVTYATVGLLLIVAQGVLLDWITTFLLDQLKLERLD